MFKLSKLYTIKSGDFHIAWLNAMNNVLKSDVDLVFGSPKEPKYAKDSCQVIELTGNAIDQIDKEELHPDFSFRSIAQYKTEFDLDFLTFYEGYPEEKKFSYLYIERLAKYSCPDIYINQLDILRDQLEDQINTGIASNRSQAITWQPEKDIWSSASPCLQSIRNRYCGSKNGIDYGEVKFLWRSRDLWNAWQPNLIALVWMMNKYVYGPNNCKIARVIDMNDSLHIYKGDVEQARQVVEKNLPFNMR